MKKILILVSGGSGERYKAKIPKQYTKPLSGDYYILDSVRPFLKFDFTDIIIVCDLAFIDTIKNIFGSEVNIRSHFCKGGSTRQLSINNAISLIEKSIDYDENTFFFLQEAVRPFVSEAIVNRLIEADKSYSNVSAAINPSVLFGKFDPHTKEVGQLIEKSNIAELQLPKRYNLSKYIEYMNKHKGDHAELIDESLYFTENNDNIFCVEGEFENIKITMPSHSFIAKGIREFKESKKI